MNNEVKQPPFDQSFYVMCIIAHWILVGGALESPEGREQVRQAFRDALMSAGSFEALQAIPEFRAAMLDVQRVQSGEILTDDFEPTQYLN